MTNSIHDLVVLSDSVTIIRGDCRAVLPVECDAVVTDPPYGINWRHGGNRGKWGGRSTGRITGKVQPVSQTKGIIGDDRPFDPSPFLDLAPKCLFWGAIHFANRLPTSRHWIVWDKHLANNGTDFAECDFAWTNVPGNAVIHRQLWNGCLVDGEERRERNGRTRCHPTQKPIALMSFCIARMKLAPGAHIVDPYMGSATTGIAAIRAGHRFTGIEIDPEHFATGKNRLERELERGPMLPLWPNAPRERTAVAGTLDGVVGGPNG